MKSLPMTIRTKASQRATVIFQVRAGQMTATAAAKSLGISRQQYYQWEQRALQALLRSLENQPTGRPRSPVNPEKAQLQHRVKQLEQQVQVYEQKEKLRLLLNQWAARPGLPSAKKKPK
jgi:transposase